MKNMKNRIKNFLMEIVNYAGSVNYILPEPGVGIKFFDPWRFAGM